ncbi:YbaK/EbsC family protein [Irregularibacter muris]|uniref:YbaK/EbsC family protein n=1 Tax=Irregularibacter muris TaxID=1796619 RepID=A0AAE3L2M7_9FIRM|nr:YbaK/EbsC family protein [Irregularibacter muris]MCR1898859.1 YbaK/EbsC family protein [Irregularibacter muris]
MLEARDFSRERFTLDLIEMDTSTATVELAAEALGIAPAMIAKTMALRLKERDILIVVKGDGRIDNRKFKDYFTEKAKFIKAEDIEEATGHPVGGVCPLGLIKPLDIYLDTSLKAFDFVYPAAGGVNTCVKVGVDYLAEITKGIWVDICSE